MWIDLAILCCLKQERPRNSDGFSPLFLEQVLKMINWSSGRCQDFTQHSDSLQTCHFSPSGTLLFTVAFNEILLWDVHDLWGTRLHDKLFTIFIVGFFFFLKWWFGGMVETLCRMFTVSIFIWFLKCSYLTFYKYTIFFVDLLCSYFLINENWNDEQIIIVLCFGGRCIHLTSKCALMVHEYWFLHSIPEEWECIPPSKHGFQTSQIQQSHFSQIHTYTFTL